MARHGRLWLALLLTGFLTGISPSALGLSHVAANGPTLAIDANPAGNEPADLAEIDSCVSVSSGESFQVDVIIQDVTELLAWEMYLEYDPAVLEVEDRDVRLFQDANPGSSVFDVSEAAPDNDGFYRLAAADTADPPSPDTGSGVLARVTLKAIDSGESNLAITDRDVNGDGRPDSGAFLRDVASAIIGDEDGDTFFDGPRSDAIVAVERPCPTNSNPISVSVADEGGVRLLVILAPLLGGLAALSLPTLLILYRRRRRPQPP